MTGSKVVMLSSFVFVCFFVFLKPLAVKMAVNLDKHMY